MLDFVYGQFSGDADQLMFERFNFFAEQLFTEHPGVEMKILELSQQLLHFRRRLVLLADDQAGSNDDMIDFPGLHRKIDPLGKILLEKISLPLAGRFSTRGTRLKCIPQKPLVFC